MESTEYLKYGRSETAARLRKKAMDSRTGLVLKSNKHKQCKYKQCANSFICLAASSEHNES